MTAVVLLFLAAIIFLAYKWFWPTLWDVPFVPTSEETVRDMVTLLDPRPGERAADLGAGDGKMVIALAKAGLEAHGFETNPILVWHARRNIKAKHLEGRAMIHLKNFWGVTLAEFDVITVYGAQPIMKRLSRKLQEELKLGARVVSNYFPLPAWPCEGVLRDAHLYRKTEVR